MKNDKQLDYIAGDIATKAVLLTGAFNNELHQGLKKGSNVDSFPAVITKTWFSILWAVVYIFLRKSCNQNNSEDKKNILPILKNFLALAICNVGFKIEDDKKRKELENLFRTGDEIERQIKTYSEHVGNVATILKEELMADFNNDEIKNKIQFVPEKFLIEMEKLRKKETRSLWLWGQSFKKAIDEIHSQSIKEFFQERGMEVPLPESLLNDFAIDICERSENYD